MKALILHNYFRSSTSYRVRIAMHLKNLDFDYVAVPLLESAQLKAEYLKINPQGEVPTLIHNGKAIAQSLPIMEYLDEVFPEPRIYPKDPFQRAVVRQFCENINSYLHPLTNLKVQKYLETKFGYQQAEKEAWAAHWYETGLPALEKMALQYGGKYSVGDEITAADLCLIPMLFSARRFSISLEAAPTLLKIEKACLEIPAFAKSHPKNQPDSPPA